MPILDAGTLGYPLVKRGAKPDVIVPPSSVYRPLFPEDYDQGDPYILAPPPEVRSRFRYCVYTTDEDPISGRAFPVYGSQDLQTWQRLLDDALVVDRQSSHWAPCVQHLPQLELPFVMLYSRAIGVGPEGHVGHTIRRAHARHAEGPFVDSGHVLTGALDFAIDPDVYRPPDGALQLAFAIDFVEDEPYGTGIVEAPISEDLTRLVGPPRILARPRYDWHIYEPSRVMPWKTIPGIDWSRHAVRWHTVEAPVGGLVSPRGKRVYFYSGGCFYGFYAVGALVEEETGELRDVNGGEHDFVIGPRPDDGFFAPGHCSLLRLADGEDYLLFHARFGAPDAKCQMALAPLRWSADGRPTG